MASDSFAPLLLFTLMSKKHTESFTLVKGSPHSRAGGAVTVTNPTAILDSAGIDHIVTAYVL